MHAVPSRDGGYSGSMEHRSGNPASLANSCVWAIFVSATAAEYTPADLYRFITDANPAYRAYWIGMRLWPIRSADDLMKITRQGNLLFRVKGS